MCHQSWLAVWRNAWKALLRESGSIHIVLLLTYSLIVSFNVISVASEYQIHPNSANIDKVKINTICWIFWKLFWDSIPKTFYMAFEEGVELLGQSGGLSPIRNPRHVLCHQSPRLHNRLQSWKGSQIKLLKCHPQHSLTLTDWMFVWFVSIFCFLKVYYSHRLVEGRKQLKLACLSANSAVRCTVLHPTRLSTVPSQMAFFPDVRANERLSGND